MSSYIEKTFTPGEKFIVFKRRHYLFWLKPALWETLILCLGAGAYLLLYTPQTEVSRLTFVLVLLGVIGGVSLLLYLFYWIKHRSLEYAVTNKRVILKKGFFQTDTDEIRNERLENIQIKQSLLGRLFSYGDIEFKGTGESVVVFSFIATPLETKKHIESTIFKRVVREGWQAKKG